MRENARSNNYCDARPWRSREFPAGALEILPCRRTRLCTCSRANVGAAERNSGRGGSASIACASPRRRGSATSSGTGRREDRIFPLRSVRRRHLDCRLHCLPRRLLLPQSPLGNFHLPLRQRHRDRRWCPSQLRTSAGSRPRARLASGGQRRRGRSWSPRPERRRSQRSVRHHPRAPTQLVRCELGPHRSFRCAGRERPSSPKRSADSCRWTRPSASTSSN